MPYIRMSERAEYEEELQNIEKKWYGVGSTEIAGDFTYIVFRLMKTFNGRFWTRALGIGCLVMAILEMYRTDHGTYEEIKRVENGDVK